MASLREYIKKEITSRKDAEKVVVVVVVQR